MSGYITDEDAIAALDAFQRFGEIKRAAEHLGIRWHTCKRRVVVAEERNLGDSLSGGRIPDGFSVNGASTLYDAGGKKVMEWVKTSRDKELLQDKIDAIREALSGIEPIPEIPSPSYCEDQSLTAYPIPDAHIGMKAWIDETGENYDLKIASRRLQFLASTAVNLSPASHTAIVLGLGDMTHANDATNMTPRSKHVLDVDSRPFLTLEVTIAANVAIIEAAARKHKQVIVRVLPGNHDQDAYLAIMFALAERYRENPRVKVQKTPSEFFVFQHGKVMIAAHHGHGAKAQQLAMFMADEHAEIWGKTKFRHLFTGHLHHYKASDLGGIMHEQLRAVAPRDAYAISNAYSARSDMQAITFDAEWGEVSRVRVPAIPEREAA